MSAGLLIWEGLLYGLTLAIMLGPIFVAITQTGIEKGFRAGLLVGTGIWTSDILIIGCLYAFIESIPADAMDGPFKLYFGIIGGFILILFGLGTMRKKVNLFTEKTKYNARSIGEFWLKGFLVNTVNPFTFIFWTTLLTAYILGRGLTPAESLLFFGSIMITIIFTDALKAYLAKSIRKFLTEQHIRWVSLISGIALMIFGIVLILRVVLF